MRAVTNVTDTEKAMHGLLTGGVRWFSWSCAFSGRSRSSTTRDDRLTSVARGRRTLLLALTLADGHWRSVDRMLARQGCCSARRPLSAL
jgi:hypothetical protein